MLKEEGGGIQNAAQQAEIIAFLSNPATFGETAVERHETHGAIVFLAGDMAYKLKRAVRYPYMDYSTPELRRSMCEAELAINRRTAPDLYLRIQPILRDAGGALRFGDHADSGAALDWVVVMRRFAQEALLGELCRRDELKPSLVDRVAEVIAAFHERAEQRHDFGGAAGILRVVEENAETLRSFAGRPFEPALLNRFDELVRQSYRAAMLLLEDRRVTGFVRRCHGDLHLNNIYVDDGVPVLFDAIEFSEDFSCIDVLYDLAFLLMDLQHRTRGDLANTVLNRYLEIASDYAGVAALPLFLACRAAVRAHVSAAAAELRVGGSGLIAQATTLIASAIEYLHRGRPTLVVTAGYSGTGKSTLARALAPETGCAPGAIILRSDVIRKRLLDVNELTHLPRAGYSAEVTAKVYSAIAERAQLVLAGGHSVIADAVYGLDSERETIAAVASRAGARFCPFWLDAPAHLLEHRLDARAHDASDATAGVLHAQLATLKRPASWTLIDASDTLESTLQQARAVLYAEAGSTREPEIGSTQTR